MIRPDETSHLSAVPWSLSSESALHELRVDPTHGLTEADVALRLQRFGPNLLRTKRPKSIGSILISQLKSLIVLLLAVAATVSFLFSEWSEAVAIVAVLAINTLLGFFSELKAVRSMEALRRLGKVQVRVRRDGVVREVPADVLVPGDIALLEGGDVVTADARLLEAWKLQADESALTGESVPVSKKAEVVAEAAPVHERGNMLFKGTMVTRGSAEAVITSTGMETELGRVARLVEEAEKEVTPLEKRLEALGRRLVWLTIAIAVATSILGILGGRDLFLMIEMGIALAVAAIPEGLPIVATIALARGMWRMAKQNVLINRLSAVETLGSTTVIFTDKTGTLTENRLSLERLVLPEGEVSLSEAPPSTQDKTLRAALEIGVLCNNASLSGKGGAEVTGDPLEVALLEASHASGIERDELVRRAPEVREEAFDPVTRMMGTVHEEEGTFRVAVKGAAEAVLDASNKLLSRDGEVPLSAEEKRGWLQKNEALARAGLRVLALAQKQTASAEDPVYSDLVFVGLAGLLDPPRVEVRNAIQECHQAGINVVMVTGDQAATASTIGQYVGIVKSDEEAVVEGRDLDTSWKGREQELLDVSLFARVSPEQKLDLIAMHQKAGAVVAMTGDGVNDAPALKKADIGVAMGRRGTQVAREAADVVLKDDSFASIGAAVRQGRIIAGNIRKFLVYLLSCNVSEIMVVTGAALVQAPLPLLPLQILFLNLVTDIFPALALAFGEGDPSVMNRPPRPPKDPILKPGHWRLIAAHGAVISLSVMVAFYVAVNVLGLEGDHAVTISFLTLALAQLWHVFNVRRQGSSIFKNDITRNPWVWGALVLCVLLLLVAVYVPALAEALRLEEPTRAGWLLAVGMSLVPLLVGPLVTRIRPEK